MPQSDGAGRDPLCSNPCRSSAAQAGVRAAPEDLPARRALPPLRSAQHGSDPGGAVPPGSAVRPPLAPRYRRDTRSRPRAALRGHGALADRGGLQNKPARQRGAAPARLGERQGLRSGRAGRRHRHSCRGSGAAATETPAQRRARAGGSETARSRTRRGPLPRPGEAHLAAQLHFPSRLRRTTCRPQPPAPSRAHPAPGLGPAAFSRSRCWSRGCRMGGGGAVRRKVQHRRFRYIHTREKRFGLLPRLGDFPPCPACSSP